MAEAAACDRLLRLSQDLDRAASEGDVATVCTLDLSLRNAAIAVIAGGLDARSSQAQLDALETALSAVRRAAQTMDDRKKKVRKGAARGRVYLAFTKEGAK
jgi:hypothetical protein